MNQDASTAKAAIDKISPSFCAAKWLQTTLHLHDGFTHSCYHPQRHIVPLREIIKNPDALHNTEFKLKQQALMLQGVRPPECSYCWKIEDLPSSPISDRHIKSGESWAWPHLDRLASLKPGDRVNPTYLEVSFSTACNFKCSYCSPNISSAWRQEVRQHGPNFGTLSGLHSHIQPSIREDLNPYITAFWQWWPDLSKTLEVFRVTGGEPLLSSNTWKIFDMLLKDPRPDLEFNVNSNMGVDATIIEKLIKNVEMVLPNIKRFMMYTSADTYGPDAEYARNGLVWPTFEDNIQRFLQVPSTDGRVKLCFMVTYNVFSPPNFRRFLEYVLDLKQKTGDPDVRVFIDINYIEAPEFLSLKAIDGRFLESMVADHEFMMQNAPYFNVIEIEKYRRCLEFMQQITINQDHKHHQSAFVQFVREHDKRRGTDFRSVFPSMADLIV